MGALTRAWLTRVNSVLSWPQLTLSDAHYGNTSNGLGFLKPYFVLFVIAAIVLGVLTGCLLSENLSPADAETAGDYLGIITDLFLRLIRMVIAPLVFSTLVTAIARMEGAVDVGRLGIKCLVWFFVVASASLVIGVAMVQLVQPGAGMNLPQPGSATDTAIDAISAQTFNLRAFIAHVIPTSIFDAMANNEVLQIVVFALFVGTAIGQLDDRAPVLMTAAEQLGRVMLKVTGCIMRLAPFAIFAALASTIATHGIGIVLVYAKFLGGFYLALLMLCALLLLASTVAVGKRLPEFMRMMRGPVLLAFSTASSEAAYPGILEGLQRFGVPRRIGSFVLPLGYSFNLDGSTMYTTFAALFIAQAYGVQLTFGQQFLMMAILMVTSKGIAGVPRASLVVVMAVLPFFHLPAEGIALVLGIDHLLDMGRSATNVVGNSVAAVVVSAWEKKLDITKEAAA
ncbi:dicarboxylate/amino acid:cation symporter [Bradyrhizobium sp.]|uniref:dicarboxylate/amino acid:cation symporter n=1 Tax=Bradyrhizobium sp. TaxID=376 RepID=UPI0039E512DD